MTENLDNSQVDTVQSVREHLADLVLRQAMSKSIVRRLKAAEVRCLVLEVPHRTWVLPLTKAAMNMLGDGVEVLAGADVPSKFRHDDPNVAMVEKSKRLVAVSQSPGTNLGPSVMAACDQHLTLQPVDPSLLVKLSRVCLRVPLSRRQASPDLRLATFDELAACFPWQGEPELATRRLLALASKAKVTEAGSVPRLEDARGYGAAQVWAMDLQRDLEDVRSGIIPLSEVDRGAVLVGPPGTGKTLFSRILGKACNLPVISASIGELFAHGKGDLGDVIQGARTVFDQARQSAPCLLFLDELDALPNRATISSRGRDWWLPVITDFLLQLDSTLNVRAGVIVLGATNHADQIDEALMRPGRLERSIWIGPPDPASLAAILRYYLAGALPDADLLPLTIARQGSTGAEAEEWARAARRRARRAGRPLTFDDLAAIILPADPRSADEKRRAAVHESGHALASVLLGVDFVERVTIERNGRSGGHTHFTRRIGDFSTLAEIEARVTTLLAGRAAEQVLLGVASSASGGDAASDLALATNLVALAHTALGLGAELTWWGLPDQTLTMQLADPALRHNVTRELDRLLVKATTLLEVNRPKLVEMTEQLLSSGSLSGDEVRQIVADVN